MPNTAGATLPKVERAPYESDAGSEQAGGTAQSDGTHVDSCLLQTFATASVGKSDMPKPYSSLVVYRGNETLLALYLGHR